MKRVINKSKSIAVIKPKKNYTFMEELKDEPSTRFAVSVVNGKSKIRYY